MMATSFVKGALIGATIPVLAWCVWRHAVMVGPRGDRIRNRMTVWRLRRELERELRLRGGP